MTDRLLNAVYFNENSPSYLSGIKSVLTEARKRNKKITREDVIGFLSKQNVYTLHKPARRRFPRNKTIPSGIDTDWQADLMDMTRLKNHNKGYAYVLGVIDVLSKYSWGVPVKNKKPETVARAFADILKSSGRRPWRLMTDRGLEFVGTPFQDFLNKNLIQHITSTNKVSKAQVVERWNRTIKSRIWKHFTKSNSKNYLKILPKIIDAYHKSYHRTIRMRPIDVNESNEKMVRNYIIGDIPSIENRKPFKYEVGQFVRISKHKGVFEKGYLPNFSKQIYIIIDRNRRHPPVYRIADSEGTEVPGIFYHEELTPSVELPEEPRNRKPTTRYLPKEKVSPVIEEERPQRQRKAPIRYIEL